MILLCLGLFFSKASWKGGILLTFSVFFVLAFFAYLINGDWAFMYFVKASDLPSYIPYVILLLYPLIFFLSILLGKTLGKDAKKLKGALMFSLGLFGAVFLLTADRAFFYGSFEEFSSEHKKVFSPAYLLTSLERFFLSDLGLLVLVGGSVFIITLAVSILKDEGIKSFWFGGRSNRGE